MLSLSEILGSKLEAGGFMVQTPRFSWKAYGCWSDGGRGQVFQKPLSLLPTELCPCVSLCSPTPPGRAPKAH